MSHIPNAAMPHAQAHHPEHENPPTVSEPLGGGEDKANPAVDSKAPEPAAPVATAEVASRSALDLIRAYPKTAAAIGAALVAGLATAIATTFPRVETKPRGRRARKTRS